MTSPAKGTDKDQEKDQEYDKSFAITCGVVIAVAWVMTAWPLFWQVEKLLDGAGTIRDVIATMLAILGSIVLAIGSFVAALETRSTMRARREAIDTLTANDRFTGPDAKAIGEGLAAVLDAFGKLPPAALLLATALGLFGGAATLAWS
jgi:hypothetical protein